MLSLLMDLITDARLNQAIRWKIEAFRNGSKNITVLFFKLSTADPRTEEIRAIEPRDGPRAWCEELDTSDMEYRWSGVIVGFPWAYSRKTP